MFPKLHIISVDIDFNNTAIHKSIIIEKFECYGHMYILEINNSVLIYSLKYLVLLLKNFH